MFLVVYKILTPFPVTMENAFSGDKEKVILNSGHIVCVRRNTSIVPIKKPDIGSHFDFETTTSQTGVTCLFHGEEKCYHKRTEDSFCVDIFDLNMDSLRELENLKIVERIDINFKLL